MADEYKYTSTGYLGKALVPKEGTEKGAKNFTMFWMLLEAGADFNASEDIRNNLLVAFTMAHYSSPQDAQEQWTLLLNLLKKNGVDIAKQKDPPVIFVYLLAANATRGLGSLFGSVGKEPDEQLAIVKTLMKAGADIHATQKGMTILMLVAGLNQNRELLQGLIDLGAGDELLAEDEDGQTLLDILSEFVQDTPFNHETLEWLKKLYYDKLLED